MVSQKNNNFQKRICGNSFNQKHKNLCFSKIFLPKQYFLLDQIFLAVTGLPLVCQPQIPLSTTAAFCSLHPPFLYTSIYKHTLTYKTQVSTSLTWFHIVLKYLLLIFSYYYFCLLCLLHIFLI